MTRLLIVGSGSIGSRHARNAVALGVREIAVVDSDPQRRTEVAQQTKATPFATVDEALAWEPTTAVICTPPADHVGAATACVRAGCDLLIEKPLSANRDGVQDLAHAIDRAGTRAAIAYQLRFHPAVARMRDFVHGGNIGRLISIQASFGQYLPAWRPTRDYRETYTAHAERGGGILLDASHEIDYVRWIAGEIRSVYAAAAQLSDLAMNAEDTAALVLRFETAVLGEIHLDCVRRGYARTCTLIGSEATVEWDFATGLTVTSAGGDVDTESIVPDGNAPYLAELAAFLEGRSPPDPPLASFQDGRRVLDIVLAAKESASTRCEVAV